MPTLSMSALGGKKVDPPFDEESLCQCCDVWPVLLDERTRLDDHCVDESLGTPCVVVSRQQSKVLRFHTALA
jgi:hypothetical protein